MHALALIRMLSTQQNNDKLSAIQICRHEPIPGQATCIRGPHHRYAHTQVRDQGPSQFRPHASVAHTQVRDQGSSQFRPRASVAHTQVRDQGPSQFRPHISAALVHPSSGHTYQWPCTQVGVLPSSDHMLAALHSGQAPGPIPV